ncbi:abortive infection protein [Deinococcus aerius]|uniref:Abortive infection protein n=1 Tax=Deinococcus aerius TaxID=200253 RepID=A0A2I9D0Z5_9DEIO|nr:type II CAAX endopeptidase family protein [Deinococcus aerius]GBF04016.1 abortive infection protein [Deinococcus aerius]
MTAPDVPPTPVALTPEGTAPSPSIRAVDGNRAALALLITQNVVSAVLLGLRLPLGLSLLGAFVGTVLVGLIFFRPTLTALVRDTRWRTPPAWGTALAAFVLAFLASRAFVLAYVTLFPGGADAIPQFLSRGADLWPLLLAAGLLVPFAEEVAFRGLMLRGHERAAGFLVAAVTTSLAFGIAHGVPASVVGILPLAYALARLVQHTGSLWNSVIVHALNNTLAVALGSIVAGRDLGDPSQATAMLKNPALAGPLALGALLFGVVVLAVLHLWLTPKPDPRVRSAPGPWLSAAYVIIVLFGLVSAAYTLPIVQQALTTLRGALR